MAYTSQSALLSDIILSVLDQLNAVTDINTAYIIPVASDEYETSCVEAKFIYVRFYGLTPFTDAGAGRRARPVTRRLRIFVYTRSNLDQYTHDNIALLEAADNHEVLELQTIDALDEFYPKDSDDNLLTIEPLHPLDSSSGPPLRKPENDLGLLRSHFDYEIKMLNRVQTPSP